MIRLIKRYESRKLYDTEESRYVSLPEVAAFVRAGQQVRVVESSTGEDVTAQTLAQVILEEGRSGERRWSSETLHELLRRGERVVQETLRTGAEQVQQGVDSLLKGSLGRLQPVRAANVELDRLRDRLDDLEGVLARFESEQAAAPRSAPAGARPGRDPGANATKKTAKKKATSTATTKSRAASRKRASGTTGKPARSSASSSTPEGTRSKPGGEP